MSYIASIVPTVVVGRHGRSARYDTVTDDNTTFAALGPISLTSVDPAGRHIGAIADRRKPSTQIKLSPHPRPRRTTAAPPVAGSRC